MTEHELKTQVAVLANTVDNLSSTVERNHEALTRAQEATDKNIRWVVVAILGGVVTAVLRNIGLI